MALTSRTFYAYSLYFETSWTRDRLVPTAAARRAGTSKGLLSEAEGAGIEPGQPPADLAAMLAHLPVRSGRKTLAHPVHNVQDHSIADRKAREGERQQGQTARPVPLARRLAVRPCVPTYIFRPTGALRLAARLSPTRGKRLPGPEPSCPPAGRTSCGTEPRDRPYVAPYSGLPALQLARWPASPPLIRRWPGVSLSGICSSSTPPRSTLYPRADDLPKQRFR